jgi:2'-hydroxyisoflavone reductase
MKLLVLGGTRFLGRHLVEIALARGHDVTTFTRGRTTVPWMSQVAARVGDRDPRIGPGLTPLSVGEWDAAIDTSGYVPRCVRAAAAALAGRVAHYTFVSSLSVYADASRPGIDETAPVATLEDPASEDVKAHYGALKACCEEEIRAVFRDRALIVRPGLIVGPFDPTDRFAYWVARFRQPGLLGARSEAAVVPGPRDRPVQFIDARDLAMWILDGVEAGRAGTFNACSPAGLWTMGALVEALVARGRGTGSAPVPAWVDDATLVGCGIVPWTGLPLWIPATDPESAAFMDFACARALAHGLAIRPLAQTIDDTATWLGERDNGDAWRNVMSAEKEREVLAAVGPERSGASPAATGVRS